MVYIYIVSGYLIAGILFSIWFVTKGVDKIDESSHGSTTGFRLIILPGTVLLWPLLFKKLLSKFSNDL
jgi:hypothetical protein